LIRQQTLGSPSPFVAIPTQFVMVHRRSLRRLAQTHRPARDHLIHRNARRAHIGQPL
jgi:hypothetical protein